MNLTRYVLLFGHPSRNLFAKHNFDKIFPVPQFAFNHNNLCFLLWVFYKNILIWWRQINRLLWLHPPGCGWCDYYGAVIINFMWLTAIIRNNHTLSGTSSISIKNKWLRRRKFRILIKKKIPTNSGIIIHITSTMLYLPITIKWQDVLSDVTILMII